MQKLKTGFTILVKHEIICFHISAGCTVPFNTVPYYGKQSCSKLNNSKKLLLLQEEGLR